MTFTAVGMTCGAVVISTKRSAWRDLDSSTALGMTFTTVGMTGGVVVISTKRSAWRDLDSSTAVGMTFTAVGMTFTALYQHLDMPLDRLGGDSRLV